MAKIFVKNMRKIIVSVWQNLQQTNLSSEKLWKSRTTGQQFFYLYKATWTPNDIYRNDPKFSDR